jgi:hypothetical protein
MNDKHLTLVSSKKKKISHVTYIELNTMVFQMKNQTNYSIPSLIELKLENNFLDNGDMDF